MERIQHGHRARLHHDGAEQAKEYGIIDDVIRKRA